MMSETDSIDNEGTGGLKLVSTVSDIGSSGPDTEVMERIRESLEVAEDIEAVGVLVVMIPKAGGVSIGFSYPSGLAMLGALDVAKDDVMKASFADE